MKRRREGFLSDDSEVGENLILGELPLFFKNMLYNLYILKRIRQFIYIKKNKAGSEWLAIII